MRNDRGGGLDKKESTKEGWVTVVKGSKITKKADPYYLELSNSYATLGKFSANPGPINSNIKRCANNSTSLPKPNDSVFKAKAAARHESKTAAYIAAMNDDGIIDQYINLAEDERTSIAKNKGRNIQHSDKKTSRPTTWEKGLGLVSTVATAACRLFKQIKQQSKQRVRFSSSVDTQEYDESAMTAEVTYDSGADGNYMSEEDRARLGLPILRESTKRVKSANGGASKGKHVTALPFFQLSREAAEADTFDEFKTSLTSVGKTADDGNVSVFTKKGVKIYKEEDVLITCKGEPILAGKIQNTSRTATRSVEAKEAHKSFKEIPAAGQQRL